MTDTDVNEELNPIDESLRISHHEQFWGMTWTYLALMMIILTLETNISGIQVSFRGNLLIYSVVVAISGCLWHPIWISKAWQRAENRVYFIRERTNNKKNYASNKKTYVIKKFPDDYEGLALAQIVFPIIFPTFLVSTDRRKEITQVVLLSLYYTATVAHLCILTQSTGGTVFSPYGSIPLVIVTLAPYVCNSPKMIIFVWIVLMTVYFTFAFNQPEALVRLPESIACFSDLMHHQKFWDRVAALISATITSGIGVFVAWLLADRSEH